MASRVGQDDWERPDPGSVAGAQVRTRPSERLASNLRATAAAVGAGPQASEAREVAAPPRVVARRPAPEEAAPPRAAGKAFVLPPLDLLSPPPPPVVVEADEQRLAQSLLNLVVNARDGMPHGGRLTIDDYRVSRRIPAGGVTTLEFRADRPVEHEAVRTTIVGGRPPGAARRGGAGVLGAPRRRG